MAGDADDVVIVGHSLAGLTVALVPERRPVRRLVYLCALVPMPGLSFREQLEVEPDSLFEDYEAGMSDRDDQGRRHWVDPEIARRTLFGDCVAEDARAAFDRLRPQSSAPHVATCGLESLPDVARTYIVCSDDAIVNPERGRAVAAGRLDAELIELPGSHSPFLSRPSELAAVLDERCSEAE
jgi:pimeloyl-ACP methyl ester carboxylesterase